ncbi:DUF1569 domain-containing protein [Maribacter halichondriae]|uniref:DUF1569 domain-containing protein n=1 Tax=Maribacter halichondriae TaxID=2980554 RepID=UPI0023588F49|nr:DUF1569 domain-containing protein [Maribacter sp. Hal144]
MNEVQLEGFLRRIVQLTPEHQPKFGKMNVHQMVCHCTDQLRLSLGMIKADDNYTLIDPSVVKNLALAKKPVPTPKGLGQVEGDGTSPTTFENDKALLKSHLLEFLNLPEDFDYAPHPYFGKSDRKSWMAITIYHLDHHLSQFNA